MQENNDTWFSIYECVVPFFSKELKTTIVNLGNCVSCGKNPNFDLSPCSCELDIDHPILSYWHLEKNCGAKTYGPYDTCDDFIGCYKTTHENWREIQGYLKRDTLKEQARRGSRKRRQREKSVIGFHEDFDIKEIYKLQKGLCCFCGIKLGPFKKKDSFDIDHLKPISKGGTNWPNNIALACKNCNRKKHNKGLDVFWRNLKKIKGEEFIEKRKDLLKSSYGRKIELTNNRKKISKKII